MKLQSEASTDLARVAAVQRSLDRALTLHAQHRRGICSPPARTPGAGQQNLLNALRAQLDLTWALPATPEVAAITDSLRQPAAQYFESAEANLRENAGGATALGIRRSRAAARRARNRDCAMR